MGIVILGIVGLFFFAAVLMLPSRNKRNSTNSDLQANAQPSDSTPWWLFGNPTQMDHSSPPADHSMHHSQAPDCGHSHHDAGCSGGDAGGCDCGGGGGSGSD